MTKISRRNLAHYALEQLLKGKPAAKLGKEIASVLVQDNRVGEIELLLADINYELESRGKVAEAAVVVASELSDNLRAEIKNIVKRATKVDQVFINQKIDKSVIGGVRIETATRVWDKTVTSQLQNLKGVF